LHFLWIQSVLAGELDKEKSPCNFSHGDYLFGAQKKTRTSTPLQAPAPEAGASTNFAIWARSLLCNKIGLNFIDIENMCLHGLFDGRFLWCLIWYSALKVQIVFFWPKKKPRAITCTGLIYFWCPEEDSNFHALAGAST
jgi:hypothetical protein